MPLKPTSTPMTLRRRFLIYNLSLVMGLLITGGISVWRLGLLREKVDLSSNVYAELRTVGNVGVEVGTVRGLFADAAANRQPIIEHLTYAIGGLDQFIQVGQGYGSGGDAAMQTAYVPINQAADAARSALRELLAGVTNPKTPHISPESQRNQIDAVMNELDRVAASCASAVSDRQQSAAGDLRLNVALFSGLCLAAVAAAVLLSAAQNRRIIGPLTRLREGVRRAAAADFTQRLDRADMAISPEFSELGADFNRMASELDGFYTRLEEQLRTKGRELMRSDRLASVGLLAAGVAHEINNPLNIISGHAELTARQISPGREPLVGVAADEARESLKIIQDEAFRCKEITEKLLSLARNNGDAREWLDLGGVARDVAAMTKGLRDYRGRRLTLKLDSAEPLEVDANPSEMKQVLLNLTINALEAVAPEAGEVCIEGRRTADWVELCVKDNGRGMGADVLSQVFEPFFTSRRGPERGTGLGLSVTHAIVESHGGRIRAESAGLGQGARFTIQFPTRRREVVGA